MKGVLLLAHGTPDSLDQMPEYLARVRGGRPPTPELVAEMRHNYAAIGGRSPLTDITRAQAEALHELLEIPVYFGMRNWFPLIGEVLPRARAEGVEELVAIPLAPQYSTLSVGKYQEAVLKATPGDLRVRFVESWHEHPLLLDAFALKLRQALEKGPPDIVVFTAHSLPERVVSEGDPYPDHVAATARGVASRAGLGSYRLAYQSAGRTAEPWLGPSLAECLSALAEEGARSALIAPVGFVCDHTEILFDIDVQAASLASAKGLKLTRTESLNTEPLFIRALAELAR
jgi:ferrochelatase